jgi:hypothetical protein
MASSDEDILKDEREAYERAYEAESENRKTGLEDLRFSAGEQWPDQIKTQRQNEHRPVLTLNRMPSFIRQVVNDGRMNRPQIKVKPVDDNADPDTANVFEGLIRNIEYESKADVAYDTGLECACRMGWGYWRIAIEYEHEATFDRALRIQRVSNPFSVVGDPNSTEADSSDWNRAFVTEHLTKAEFRAKYKGADEVNWETLGYDDLVSPWKESDDILVAESWKREIVPAKIYMIQNAQSGTSQVIGEDAWTAAGDILPAMGWQIVNERMADKYQVTQRIMTGAEVLESNKWAGKFIPIVPCYGEELNIEGKRMFRSLIHNAMDAQRMFNYWRTAATEIVALSPKMPFIGRKGAFDSDPNWNRVNDSSLPFLEYEGNDAPQRQPIDTEQAIGSMSQALAASSDMKDILGIQDASLGIKSNETSGKAIMARQREGDVSTFHFIDNLSRAIRHTGSILVDLIPKVYSGERIVRVLGVDGENENAKLGSVNTQQGQPQQPQTEPPEMGESPETQGIPEGADRIYDISAGRYDVAVDTGPSFTTRREEQAQQMTEFIRAYPQAAPIIGDLLVKSLDWQNAEEIAERLKAMLPPQIQQAEMPPELSQMIQQGQEMIQQLQDDNKKLKDGKEVEAYNAETNRIKELLPYMPPEALARLGLQMSVQAIQTPDVAPGAAPDQGQAMPPQMPPDMPQQPSQPIQ